MIEVPLLVPEDSPVAPPSVTFDAGGNLRIGGTSLTREEFEAIEQIRNSQFFLFRNDGGELGERAPCRWHTSDPMSGRLGRFDEPVYHSHFTVMCVEKPWRGLEDGLRCWVQAASEGARKSRLISGMGLGLKDYSSTHPFTGGALRPATPDTYSWYSYLLGVSEPITPARARRLAEKINDRRPPIPFVL